MLRKKEEISTIHNNPYLRIGEYFIKKDAKNLGLAVADLNGGYGDNKNRSVDQVIYIIDGKVCVQMNNRQYSLEKEDAIFIKKGTWYRVEGKAKFLVATSPAWYDEQYETRIA